MDSTKTQTEKKHALVVEDSRFTRTVICDNLKDAGYETVDVATGGAALKYLEADWPDVVLLDMRLPDISGFDLLPQIKQSFPTVPVVVLTAVADISHRIRGIRLGADDYLTKPFVPEELLARVDNVLRLRRNMLELQYARTANQASRQRDELTGLLSRTALQEDLEQSWLHAGATGMSFSVLMVDMDSYREIGRQYGPAAADQAIRHVAEQLGDLVRETDVVGRFGDDEFLLILTRTSQRDAERVASRLQNKLAITPCVLPDGTDLLVTVSIGAAAADPDQLEPVEHLLRIADSRMEQSRLRNRAAAKRTAERNLPPAVVVDADAPSPAWLKAPVPMGETIH